MSYTADENKVLRSVEYLGIKQHELQRGDRDKEIAEDSGLTLDVVSKIIDKLY